MQKSMYLIIGGLLLLAFILTVISLFITSGTYLLIHDPKAIDFLAFYTGASTLAHIPQATYDLSLQRMLQGQIAPVTSSLILFLPFLNPPFVALLFVPLLSFGLIPAYAIWVTLQVLFFVWLLVMSYYVLQKEQWYTRIGILIGMGTFLPILTTLLLGQLSIILCLIFFLSWRFLQKGQQFSGGLLLSLVAIKPHFLIVPLLFVLLQRRKRLVAGMLTGIVICLLISFALIGWDGMVHYGSLLIAASQWDTGYGIDITAQHSLQTLLLLLFPTKSLADIRLVWLLSIIVLMVPAGIIWLKKTSLTSPLFTAQFSLMIILMLVTSPHTHFHDLSLLVVVAVILLHQVVSHKKVRRQIIGLLLGGYLIALGGYFGDLITHTSSRPLWIGISVSYLLLLWFFFVRLWLQLQKRGVY